MLPAGQRLRALFTAHSSVNASRRILFATSQPAFSWGLGKALPDQQATVAFSVLSEQILNNPNILLLKL